jgi:predicted DNA-binding protein YlxM (UPF0122 family)
MVDWKKGTSMKKQEKQISDIITDFLSIADTATVKRQIAYDEVGRQNDLTMDYLHKLELEDLTYEERNRLMTKLRVNRLDRRYYKDVVEIYDPLSEFMKDPAHKKAIEDLKQVLGKVRKAEEYHGTRTYHPRINKDSQEK